MKSVKTILISAISVIMLLSQSITVSAFTSIAADINAAEPKVYIKYEPLSGGVTRQYMIVNECLVYDNPNNKIVGTLFIDDIITIIAEHTDNNDIQWGCFSVDNEKYNQLWIKMSDCEVIYDNVCFMEEYKAEIIDYNDELTDYSTDKPIYIWTYPNSEDAVIMKQYPPEWTTYISKTYTDENGKQWGYIAYIWNNRGWIYLDDPTANITGSKMNDKMLPHQNAKPVYIVNDMDSVVLTMLVIAVTGSILVTIAIHKAIKTIKLKKI